MKDGQDGEGVLIRRKGQIFVHNLGTMVGWIKFKDLQTSGGRKDGGLGAGMIKG